jgi:hypothetical protein
LYDNKSFNKSHITYYSIGRPVNAWDNYKVKKK